MLSRGACNLLKMGERRQKSPEEIALSAGKKNHWCSFDHERRGSDNITGVNDGELGARRTCLCPVPRDFPLARSRIDPPREN